MEELIVRGLDKTYTKEIAGWRKYLREQEFAVELSEYKKDNVNRFIEEIKLWTIPELEEFIIEGLDCLE